VKICPSCHQETFDGRATCHRCGSDVARVQPLDLPTRDAAALLTRIPFVSRHGELILDLSGVTFVDEAGSTRLAIPAQFITAVEPVGKADLRVTWRDGEAERNVRFRVHWAPSADRTGTAIPAQDRPMWLSRGRRRRAKRLRSARDLIVVRDRWLSSLGTLLKADRYAVGRRL
jgi:hypothetical protein